MRVQLRRGAGLFAVAALIGLSASGCRFGGVADLPLPGGVTSGAATYKVTAIFDDVIDLVPKAFVRVNDVAVGEVDRVRLDTNTFKARVTLKLKKSVVLPANVSASLNQTSLLGEKYVKLAPPTNAAGQPLASGATLADGATIPEDRTSRYPEVEEFFSAFSALTTGGGLGQLQTIVSELSAALAGREGNVRDLLARLTTITRSIDSRKSDIVRALDSLDRLSASLARQRTDIAAALEQFTPAVGILAAQRKDLTQLLGKLSELGKVGSRVVNTAKADTIASLNSLGPVLGTVATLRDDLKKALTNVDNLGIAVPNAFRGDYLNLRIQIQIRSDALTQLPENPTLPGLGPIPLKNAAIGDYLLGGLR